MIRGAVVQRSISISPFSLGRVKKKIEHMRIDCEAYGHDRALLATFCSDVCRADTDSNVQWNDSAACKFPVEDIANRKNKKRNLLPCRRQGRSTWIWTLHYFEGVSTRQSALS
eukprot:15344578-Ditylum_brightwellii.AAC.2